MKNIKFKAILFRVIIIAYLLGSFYIEIYSQNDTILYLSYCQDEAVRNYPSAKDKDLLKKITELKLQSIQTNLLPQMNIGGQATYQSDVVSINLPLPGHPVSFSQDKDQYKATIDINQVIYDGGSTHFQKLLENASLQTNLQQVDVDLFKIRDQVNNVFFLLLSLQEDEKLIRNSLHEINEKQKVVKSSVENGALTPSDWDILEAERLKTEQQLAEIEINRNSSLAILSILMSKPIQKATFSLPDARVSDTVKNARPEYHLFELQSQQLENSKLLSHTLIMPKISVFGEGGYGRPGLNFLNNNFEPYYIIGVTFKWNFFDWDKNKHDRQVLDVQKDMINTQKENFDKNLSIDIQNRLANIKKLEEALKRDSMIVELRSRITRSSASQLDNGVITATDYLVDLNNETSAKINYVSHKIQFVQAKTSYMLAVGRY